jgi:hypothetical protein
MRAELAYLAQSTSIIQLKLISEGEDSGRIQPSWGQTHEIFFGRADGDSHDKPYDATAAFHVTDQFDSFIKLRTIAMCQPLSRSQILPV